MEQVGMCAGLAAQGWVTQPCTEGWIGKCATVWPDDR